MAGGFNIKFPISLLVGKTIFPTEHIRIVSEAVNEAVNYEYHKDYPPQNDEIAYFLKGLKLDETKGLF